MAANYTCRAPSTIRAAGDRAAPLTFLFTLSAMEVGGGSLPQATGRNAI